MAFSLSHWGVTDYKRAITDSYEKVIKVNRENCS